jgi:nucleoside-diphosphate-sugar epimerase
VVRFDIKRTKSEDAREAQLPLSGIDRVYFLAWDVGGAKYLYREDSQLRQLDWNLKLLLNVMPQLQHRGVRFLFVSSQLAEEYDTVYGVTKRLAEVWTHLLKGVRVRLWNVYGPIEQPTERTHVVSDFAYQAVFNHKIEMMTTGEEQRHFIHIDDVCRAFHLAMSRNLQGVYDVSSFEWVKVKELAQMIAGMTGADLILGNKVGNTPITPIRGKIPGWHAEVSLQDGLQRLISDMTALRK